MDKLKENKIFNILMRVFILVSAIYVIYATVTMRGLFMDGAFLLLKQLNNFAHNVYTFSSDIKGHPRFSIAVLMQIPMWTVNFIHIHNKTVLMLVYNFTLFFLPLLVLFWDYKLSQRTKRVDVFFFHLLVYCLCLIIFSIFSVVETLIGAGLHFILWNYLVSDIEYKKRDIFAIVFLLICMSATYEYVVFLGLIFFIMHFKYDFAKLSHKEQKVKTLIGYGALFATVFNLYCMYRVKGEAEEIVRFFKEVFDFWRYSLSFCLLFSILTLVLLIIFVFKKKDFSYFAISGLAWLYVMAFGWLLLNPTASVTPVWEVHTRSIVCWALPLIFFFLMFKEFFSKYAKDVNYTNLICIVLLCGIAQTAWQNVNTYYWYKNIQYMKQELANTNEALYIPSEHPEISEFWNEDLRRYIFHSVYAATSILFSDTYEQKTLLMHYDKPANEGNLPFREFLFVYPELSNTINIPPGTFIDIKNRYWDLTKCAEALHEYNHSHNIQTKENDEFIYNSGDR